MVLGNHGRRIQHALFTPLARALLALGLSPNGMTIAGTAVTTGLALTLIPMDHLVVGSLAVAVVVLTDSVDGIMARIAGTSGPYGAFLDSTLDRIADSAIFSAVLFWFFFHTHGGWQLTGMIAAAACLALAAMVSYARAKAESLGVQASVGLAERADRVLIVLMALLLTGVGVHPGVLASSLVVLAIASAVTVIQRIIVVSHGLRSAHD